MATPTPTPTTMPMTSDERTRIIRDLNQAAEYYERRLDDWKTIFLADTPRLMEVPEMDAMALTAVKLRMIQEWLAEFAREGATSQ